MATFACALRVQRFFCVFFSCLMLGLVPTAGIAAVTVGADIAGNVTWTAAEGPYDVVAPVAIRSGATLTIEAGTQVHMAPGASLLVQGGTLNAAGTASSRILVTSAQAVPGAWGAWTFATGSNSLVEYTTFEYGSGLKVLGASPVLNFVTIRHHLGAAITVDLAASPSGIGNQATGNTLDAIAVSSGTIAGKVT